MAVDITISRLGQSLGQSLEAAIELSQVMAELRPHSRKTGNALRLFFPVTSQSPFTSPIRLSHSSYNHSSCEWPAVIAARVDDVIIAVMALRLPLCRCCR